jgi:hypothetical protein
LVAAYNLSTGDTTATLIETTRQLSKDLMEQIDNGDPLLEAVFVAVTVPGEVEARWVS